MLQSRRATAWDLSVVAYLAAVAAVGVIPAVTGLTSHGIAGVTAFSPDDLVTGKLWLLPASGLVVAGDTWSQLATLAQVAALLTVLAGGRAFWRAAVAGHVGSTVVAYAIVGILTLTAPASVAHLLSAPDYGISCVYAGALGALAVTVARRCSSRRWALAGGLVATLPLLPLTAPGFVTAAGALKLAPLEHLLAFALGAAVSSAQAERLGVHARRLLRGQLVRAHHRVEHLPLAGSRAGEVAERVVGGRRLGQTGQQRRLRPGQAVG